MSHILDNIIYEFESQLFNFINNNTKLEEELEAKVIDEFNEELKTFSILDVKKWDLNELVNSIFPP